MKTRLIFIVSVICVTMTASAQQIEYNRMLSNALQFVGTPYEAHTLEAGDTEELIYGTDALDCMTFVETAMAMSMCKEQGDDMSESEFARNLQKIRYRGGIIDGYTSRLHYATDWVDDNVKKGIIEDITAVNSPFEIPVFVNYMTNHAENYKHLAASSENIKTMQAIEERLSKETIHYLPTEEVPQTGKAWIKNGDIILITTNIPGLDCSHFGIAIYINGNLHLLDASLSAEKVQVEPLVMSRYLLRNKHTTGIRVMRLRPEAINN
ncbi:MAG: DUF1460 domain-containing protein [Prevotellaceae bacterium]|jgi:hypothetical protein|nr:DUF1460 domain-containing protein [Prevotellaceae bacterium]